MFTNSGEKCKSLAVFVCYLGIIVSIISGIVLISSGSSYYRYGNPMVFPGIIIMVIGSVASWLSSLSLYAIGEAASRSAEADRKCEQIIRELNALKEARNENVPQTTQPLKTWTDKAESNADPTVVEKGIEDKTTELKDLMDKGLLTREEYDDKAAEAILDPEEVKRLEALRAQMYSNEITKSQYVEARKAIVDEHIAAENKRNQLKELMRMKERGIITLEEYKEKRLQIAGTSGDRARFCIDVETMNSAAEVLDYLKKNLLDPDDEEQELIGFIEKLEKYERFYGADKSAAKVAATFFEYGGLGTPVAVDAGRSKCPKCGNLISDGASQCGNCHLLIKWE